jgi:glutathione S-transferase
MYTLYGSEVSLYTGKIRSYLRFKQLPFNEVLSTIDIYKKVIRPNTGVTFIPVVRTPDGQYLQDTARIIDYLEAHNPQRAVNPTRTTQRLVSDLFALWADEWLVIPAMHYRWNKDNFPFIYQEFGRVVAPKFPGFIRAYFGKKLARKFSGFVPILGITPRTILSIENWYESTVLHHLNCHFAKYDYLLGSRPCVGDFALMGPLYAHLYRDPVPGKLMKRIAPHVVTWVHRMNQSHIQQGEFIADDEIPDSLLPLLRDMFKQQWPVLRDTSNKLSEWRRTHCDEQNIPRSIGQHNFDFDGVSEQRAISSFHQYKLQRVLDTFQQFSKENKGKALALLERVGGEQYIQMSVQNRVEILNNKLVFA